MTSGYALMETTALINILYSFLSGDSVAASLFKSALEDDLFFSHFHSN